MSEPVEINAAGVQLTLDPASVRLDESGRIELADARVLSALLSGRPGPIGGLPSAEDQNLALCGGNGYQCACPSALVPERQPG